MVMSPAGSDQALVSTRHTFRPGGGAYAFVSKLSLLVWSPFLHIGFQLQNSGTSPVQYSLTPAPVRRWYLPPTKAWSSANPAPASPGHTSIRGHVLIEAFRPQGTPLLTFSEILGRFSGWYIAHKQDWDSCLKFGGPVSKTLQYPTGKCFAFTYLSLVLWVIGIALFTLLAADVAVSANISSFVHTLNIVRDVYGTEIIARDASVGPCPNTRVSSSSKNDDLVGLITYVPCSTYSILLFVNPSRIFKRPTTQKLANSTDSLAPQRLMTEETKTEGDEMVEDQEPPSEAPVSSQERRTRRTRRGKRGGASQKAYQDKKWEWYKAWNRAVNTWGNGAWLEQRAEEEVELAVD
ncbi:hypothetical protein FRC12_024608 [Ceratobasidium sp. 428]|nr:hypothetical protein FRC12_024608 [Ceratobasidium sp. 428]